MTQGFTQGITVPVPVAKGGTGAADAATARTNLGITPANIGAQPNNNVIIGGNFSTNPWQRGTTITSPVNDQYTADRFVFTIVNSTAVVNIIKTADAPTASEAGVYCTDCFHVDVTTADASVGASDLVAIRYQVEGFDSCIFGFGQSGTRYITLSFWHKHTVTGQYGVNISNNATDRSYIAEYTQSVADTWEKAEITIPVDTSGTWIGATNGIGIRIYFTLMAGTSYQGTANAWQGSFVFGSSSQVNAMSANTNNCKFALIKLEPGEVATPYPVELEADVLAKCFRYFQAWNRGMYGDGGSTTAVSFAPAWIPPMRIAPALTLNDTSISIASAVSATTTSTGSTITSSGISSKGARFNVGGWTGLTAGRSYYIDQDGDWLWVNAEF